MIVRNCQMIVEHLCKRNIFTTIQYFKSIKKYIDYSNVPKVVADDIEIQYVRGSGPGGQSTNKTNNAVVMKHKLTGIVVKCHETRSQFKNKEIAEKLLINKLDKYLNGENAIENQEKRIMKKLSIEKKRRQKKLTDMKQQFKEKQGIE